ncbi:sensor histidine kinase [Hymenobacter edaphi]|uniref:histidine kinase n=1 Tax=Hymenobacter edaphi TaxID=2211146 RepID=A0A328BTK7_9BACT|nr:ATP-binding protein [Hymenobacter edaphi]RAK70622.1 sensor histidine kinase [Hymenobacter edaphi]
MKRRIRTIFWLLAACILGINGFQAYWLYTTYQLSRTQFERTTTEALQAVVFRQQAAQLQQQFARAGLTQFQLRINDASMSVRAATPKTGANRVIVLSGAADTAAPVPRLERIIVRNHHRDSAAGARRLGVLRAAAATPPEVNLRQLGRDYRAELRRRDTEADFVLDTVSLLRPTAGRGPVLDVPATHSLRTRPVPLGALNVGGGWQVQAGLRPPTFYLLRRMGGLLAGSVLLLGLTTGCFALMLNTILRQKKLADVKNDFINNMTHELKTPLATVSAAVEAMQHFGALNDPQKTQTYLSISQGELQRLSDLVEKVLHIAVEERQALQLHLEPVHPAALVQELVQRQQLKAPKPVQFQVDIEPADVVPLDALHLGNVINNLIDNAIKYSREQVTIRLRGRRDETGWRLTVQDDGIGIPKSYQEAIFDRFFRVPTGNLHPVKGFGLGLYYVRQVVERHGGHIAVRSEPNRGSEFSLWLPV